MSEPVALAMAEGMRARAAVDVGVGVTGIAGPGGGIAGEAGRHRGDCGRDRGRRRGRGCSGFIGEREQVKFQASQAALDMVRRMLLLRELRTGFVGSRACRRLWSPLRSISSTQLQTKAARSRRTPGSPGSRPIACT